MAQDYAPVRPTVARAREENIPLTEYGLRLLIKQGKIPARRVGQKQIVYFPNVVSFFRCENGCDNNPVEQFAGTGGAIRRC